MPLATPQQRYNNFLNRLGLYSIVLFLVVVVICRTTIERQYEGFLYLAVGLVIAGLHIFLAFKYFDVTAAVDEAFKTKGGDYFTKALTGVVGCALAVALFLVGGALVTVVCAGLVAGPKNMPVLPFTLFFIPPFATIFGVYGAVSFALLRSAYRTL